MTAKLATNSWSTRHALASQQPFTTYGNFRAVNGGSEEAGRLPEPYRTQYGRAGRNNKITYTVYSYRTPIAWVLDDGSVITPPVRYSRTTSRHQGLLYALGQPVDGTLALAAHRERAPARVGRHPLSRGRPTLHRPRDHELHVRDHVASDQPRDP